MSKFQDAINSLKEAVGDLSSLEVQTISGSLTGIVTANPTGNAANNSPSSGGSIIDWKKAIKSAKASGKVELVLATKINFDGDATQFVKEGEISEHMLNAHKAALDAGKTIREELLKLAVNTVKDLLPG